MKGRNGDKGGKVCNGKREETEKMERRVKGEMEGRGWGPEDRLKAF
jgi:hypothetical protein